MSNSLEEYYDKTLIICSLQWETNLKVITGLQTVNNRVLPSGSGRTSR